MGVKGWPSISYHLTAGTGLQTLLAFPSLSRYELNLATHSWWVGVWARKSQRLPGAFRDFRQHQMIRELLAAGIPWIMIPTSPI